MQGRCISWPPVGFPTRLSGRDLVLLFPRPADAGEGIHRRLEDRRTVVIIHATVQPRHDAD